MVFDIKQLKKIRLKLGLTQNQFSREAGVSQSMVAKIESGRLDPTYSKVEKIESALNRLANVESKFAEDFMNRKIISVRPRKKVSGIIEIMNKKSISQIPVIEGNKVIGIVTESSILSKNFETVKNLFAEEIMENVPPLLDKKAGLKIVKQLLQHYSLILIQEKRKLIGIVTRADLIKYL